jgi:hypothetical protein
MGRTLATANQIILDEQNEFSNFRRALRAADQRAFDELFAFARKHTPAISMASHALPFESVLLAMLLEEHNLTLRLQEQIEVLQLALERLLNSQND